MLANLNTAIRSVVGTVLLFLIIFCGHFCNTYCFYCLHSLFLFVLQTCKLNTLFSIGEDFDDEVTVRKHTWSHVCNLSFIVASSGARHQNSNERHKQQTLSNE